MAASMRLKMTTLRRRCFVLLFPGSGSAKCIFYSAVQGVRAHDTWRITKTTPGSRSSLWKSGKDGQECDDFELYKKTQKNDKGWSTEDAELNWEIMVANEAQYDEEGIEMTEQEIVTEVLGTTNYVKVYEYGLKPPGKSKSNIHLKQLDETRDELAESRSEAATFKNMVATLTDKLNDQAQQVKENAACLAKVMALMEARGHNAENDCDV